MIKVVLMRHGQSQWNLENRFTGWKDVTLTEQGKEEAKQAGLLLKKNNYHFDLAFSSYLKRAVETLNITLSENDLHWIPVTKSWRLNERHYGALQGLNKKETAEKYGADQVFQWRRGYNTLPPLLEMDDPRHPQNDPKYSKLSVNELPKGESLAVCKQRVLPFWEKEIAPKILKGKKVLIVAHGNSLRALVQHLDQVSEEKITELNIPTGAPLVYELDNHLKPLNSYYLDKDS